MTSTDANQLARHAAAARIATAEPEPPNGIWWWWLAVIGGGLLLWIGGWYAATWIWGAV